MGFINIWNGITSCLQFRKHKEDIYSPRASGETIVITNLNRIRDSIEVIKRQDGEILKTINTTK